MKRKKAKKMLRVLRKVQRICKGQACAGCMFGLRNREGTACMLDDPPMYWNLKELGKRLLKTEESTKGNTDGEG